MSISGNDPQLVPVANPLMSLAGATLFAMTRYVECPCAENAALVARHLECAAEQNVGDAHLADLCSALAFRWRGRIMQQLTHDQLRKAH
ncbi:MAG TPA: hypothetical protein VLC92_14675 [Rhodocyclaceae bacterium]|nr:hypothetical protein [Rhodocyclaceae bacterium]